MSRDREISPVSNRWRGSRWFILILALLLAFPVITHSAASGDTPEGFVSIDELMALYPASIVKEEGIYHIMDDLDLPPTRSLYLGPGDTLLFDRDTHLNITGLPLFQGTLNEPVFLGPYIRGEEWGGINLLEADPASSPSISNMTLEEAEIGIRSFGSDLHMIDSRISNCSRSGLDIKGPLGTSGDLIIERCTVMNMTYYGIHLLKVERARISNLKISDCGTGIRTYKTTASIDNAELENSKGIGLNSVDSDLQMEGVTMTAPNGSTSMQLLSLNSTIHISNGKLSGANVVISSLTGSHLYLDGIRIGKSFTDGIQTKDSHLEMLNCDVSDSGESALHLEGTTFRVSGTTMNNNGAGTGEFVFSSVYSDGSTGKFEGCTFVGSGYANVHSVSSNITIGNSTLGMTTAPKLVLDEGSHIVLVDILPPSDVSFLDDRSLLLYKVTIRVTAVDHNTSGPISGAQVDMKDTDGVWVASAYTGPDGLTDDIPLVIYEINSSGTFSHLPITVLVQKDGYEITQHDLARPVDRLEIEMYPPNSPPSLELIAPVNGTRISGSVDLEGRISDDLDVYALKIRFDEGAYMTIDDLGTLSNGHFSISFRVRNISGGLHTLWVNAFDGTHLSRPAMRTVMVLDPRMNDTDRDGIPDMNEDLNGNGKVDPNETDPNNPDTDGDGLLDGIEIDKSDGNSTDPLNPDTDGDFLKDGFEDLNANGRVDPNETDPNNPDTDGDGVNDRDDRFPLDPLRSRETENTGDGILIIIFATIFIVLVIAAVYLLIIKTCRLGGVEEKRTESHHTHGRDSKEPRRLQRRP